MSLPPIEFVGHLTATVTLPDDVETDAPETEEE